MISITKVVGGTARWGGTVCRLGHYWL